MGVNTLADSGTDTAVADADSGAPPDAGPEAAAPLSSPLPLTGPASYPNALSEVLGISATDISSRLEEVFEQLFHGDPATEALYFAAGDDQAYIQDILHGDVRTEGMGYGMLITVQLDKRTEFDRLWRYARAALEIKSGPNRGYYSSYCDTADASREPCIDPFGHSLFVTALLLAEGRWGSTASAIDYGADALELINVMRTKETESDAVQSGVTNMFDSETHLPFDAPDTSAAGYTRPAVVMPAFYELWAQATDDPFWMDAATAGRQFWERTASLRTGLMPVRADFDGTPVSGWALFRPEAYRVHLNIVLDRIWFGGSNWEIENSDRVLGFFDSQGFFSYGRVYTLDGEPVDTDRDNSLVAVNGTTALIATLPERTAFLRALWDLETPTDEFRYFEGILQLLGLIVLAGEFRVY